MKENKLTIGIAGFCIVILVGIILFCIFGGEKRQGNINGKGEAYFNATIVKVKKDGWIVKPYGEQDYFELGSEIMIPKKTVAPKSVPDGLQVEDEIRILFNENSIKKDETPIRIETVFAIYRLKEIN